MSQASLEILFDKFEIIDCLKKDGQAAVYLANHIYLGKKIILKTLDTSDLPDNTILERFKREAKILARLSNENIIKVLDFGTFKNFFYISFEHFESVTLRDVIKNNSLTNEQKIYLLTQLLKALAVAHQNKIIHRDIKPENILVNSNLELKIADFGLALVVNETNITNSSSIVGTPGYMAPEQIHGDKTRQTDLFSTGLVAYELFTGSNPILGKDITATINNILNFNEDILAENLDKLPQTAHDSIKCMLRKNLELRAKTAEEVLNYLGVESGNTKIPESAKIKFNRKKLYIFSAAIFLFIVAGAFILLKTNISLSGQKNSAQSNTNLVTPYSGNDDLIFDEGNSVINNTADIKRDIRPENKAAKVLETVKGDLSINCYPWASVYIDKKKIDITPLNVSLSAGRHVVELFHPNYPPIYKRIFIAAGDSEAIKVNFDDITGKLECNIYPWGDVYINNKFIGTTPLRKPVVLMPGTYRVTVKNKDFKTITKKVTITAQKTNIIDVNFDKK